MSSVVSVDLFAEDEAHVRFCRRLIERVGAEVDLRAVVSVRTGSGGIGVAQTELRAYVKALARGLRGASMPDLLCAAVDANCLGHAERRCALVERIDQRVVPRVAFLCPDPHVERWYLSDPRAFREVVGSGFATPPAKCERHLYKRLLREAVRQAGQEPILEGVEYGEELAGAIDLYHAGKAVPSLGAAVQELRKCLVDLKRSRMTSY
jgi:hypothetical protein